jgi:hypothetical protein
MVSDTELNEYLEEIRTQVCSHCIERPPGGPPCTPLGKVCGVELHLAQLIEAVREVKSGLLAPYLEKNEQRICSICAHHSNTSLCPCPLRDLAALIVEAVETVDQRHQLQAQV